MKDKISVIIAIYNVNSYLDKCINSVISQTYDNLEIILIDDGSTDKSGKICDKFAKLDKRIKVVHKENGGLSDARNHGIELATGEYIAFLDGDDWIDIDLYKVLYELSSNNDADIAECSFKKVYSEEEKLNTSSNQIIIYSNIEAMKEIYKEKYVEMIVAWNKLYKKSLFDSLRYPVGKIHEDEFLTPILLHKSNKIVYTSRELIYYRQRNGSIMNSEFTLKKLDFLEAISNRLEYYKSNNMKIFYKYDMQKFVNVGIDYYFKIDELDIMDKKETMLDLKKSILSANFRILSKKILIKIILFKYTPNVLKKLRNLKN